VEKKKRKEEEGGASENGDSTSKRKARRYVDEDRLVQCGRVLGSIPVPDPNSPGSVRFGLKDPAPDLDPSSFSHQTKKCLLKMYSNLRKFIIITHTILEIFSKAKDFNPFVSSYFSKFTTFVHHHYFGRIWIQEPDAEFLIFISRIQMCKYLFLIRNNGRKI